jgi:uncharacterized protein (DUF1800 family)
VLLTGCATSGSASLPASVDQVQLLNRITWGANTSSWHAIQSMGSSAYLEQQLAGTPAALPPAVQSQIDSMRISQQTPATLLADYKRQLTDIAAVSDPDRKETVRLDQQKDMNKIAREAATRSMLRDLYSPAQLQERMVWFWMNHFNVFMGKATGRLLIGDYEEKAIRPFAMRRFRDLLASSLHHPAMLAYLDNADNAINHLNENYARELMELHTMGINGGYTQQDVQELARILTGVGTKQAVFDFDAKRHDFGDKHFLGQTIKGSGIAETEQALDLLCKHPATARFISRKLALYFVSDQPSSALVASMAATFTRSDGDIAQVLRTLFASPEFAASLGRKFKDPMQYVMSALRLAYDDKPIVNPNPLLGWMFQLGEFPYTRQTPDGFALTSAEWSSSGQMTTRFEIARAIGAGSYVLFRGEGAAPEERKTFPQLASPFYFAALQPRMSLATRRALDQAATPQEWNIFLLSSPEFMHY